MPSQSIHVAKFHSFLWLNRIPYTCIFIHLSAYRHLGWFYILAILNKAAVNTEVHIYFQISAFFFFFFFSVYLEVGLLGHTIVFWETSILFSTVSIPVYIPTNSVRVPFLPCPRWAMLYCGLCDLPDWHEQQETVLHKALATVSQPRWKVKGHRSPEWASAVGPLLTESWRNQDQVLRVIKAKKQLQPHLQEKWM